MAFQIIMFHQYWSAVCVSVSVCRCVSDLMLNTNDKQMQIGNATNTFGFAKYCQLQSTNLRFSLFTMSRCANEWWMLKFTFAIKTQINTKFDPNFLCTQHSRAGCEWNDFDCVSVIDAVSLRFLSFVFLFSSILNEINMPTQHADDVIVYIFGNELHCEPHMYEWANVYNARSYTFNKWHLDFSNEYLANRSVSQIKIQQSQRATIASNCISISERPYASLNVEFHRFGWNTFWLPIIIRVVYDFTERKYERG